VADGEDMTDDERNIAMEIMWKIVVVNFIGLAAMLLLQAVFG